MLWSLLCPEKARSFFASWDHSFDPPPPLKNMMTPRGVPLGSPMDRNPTPGWFTLAAEQFTETWRHVSWARQSARSVVDVSAFFAAVSVTVPSEYTPGSGEGNELVVGVGGAVVAGVDGGVVWSVVGVPELHMVA